jgi:hypothetical protein
LNCEVTGPMETNCGSQLNIPVPVRTLKLSYVMCGWYINVNFTQKELDVG